MAYGLRTYGADGTLQLDENSFTCRVVLSTVVTFAPGPKSFQDFSVPGCNATNSIAVMIPVGEYSDTSMQLESEMRTDVARVYNYCREFEASNTVSNTMRLNVIRFA
ncbi:hypothetical protein PUP76_21915 [Pseudomonas chlororaphis]|uniref:hypothetical protein n=1 Tax=Pseudomonas chlororaphis TaxID=587753 RepID=UPI0023664B92|nr:hypothetical protein [Pseudomonas chlororaphis]WDG52507.1 hypothetical protein PUP76_21915 [Pseudomonas chlororaphis]